MTADDHAGCGALELLQCRQRVSARCESRRAVETNSPARAARMRERPGDKLANITTTKSFRASVAQPQMREPTAGHDIIVVVVVVVDDDET